MLEACTCGELETAKPVAVHVRSVYMWWTRERHLLLQLTSAACTCGEVETARPVAAVNASSVYLW